MRLSFFSFMLLTCVSLQVFGIDAKVGPEDVQIGFQGMVPGYAALVPLRVPILNDKEDLEGQIVVSQESTVGSHEVSMIYPFTAPGNSRQEHLILFRREPGKDVSVHISFSQVYDDVEFIAKTTDLKADQRLVACVGIPITELRVWNGFEAQFRNGQIESSAYRFINLTSEGLFTDPLAYDSLHSIVVDGASLATLAPAYLNAIATYVQTGGQLIIVRCLDDPRFASLLGKLGLENLSSSHVQVDYGAGRIWAESPSQPDFSLFAAGTDLQVRRLEDIFPGISSKAPHQQNSYFAINSLWPTLTKIGGTPGLSGFFWLTLIIVGYILVIGPVDFVICKITNKSYMTWPIFLGAIFVFSLLAFWYSNLIHSGDPLAVQVTFSDGAPGSNVVGSRAYYWYHSTKNKDYKIKPSAGNAHLSCRESQGDNFVTVAQVRMIHAESILADAYIPVFSSKRLDAQWIEHLPQGFEVNPTRSGFTLSVPTGIQVKNAFLGRTQGLANYALVKTDLDALTWNFQNNDPWSRVLSNEKKAIENLQQMGRKGAEDLPDDDLLRAFAIIMTFGQDVSMDWDPLRRLKGAKKEDAGQGNMGFGASFNSSTAYVSRDPWEQSINVGDWLSSGDGCLMLLVSRDDDAHRINNSVEPAEDVNVEVIRLRLPKEVYGTFIRRGTAGTIFNPIEQE